MDLVVKMRALHAEVQKDADIKDFLKRIPELIYRLIEANTYIFSSHGNLLGASSSRDLEHDIVRMILSKQGVLQEYNPIDYRMLSFEEAAVPEEYKQLLENKHAAIIPIVCGKENYGAIFMNRAHQPFTEEDQLLVEYVSSFLGVKLRRHEVKRSEVEARARQISQKALQSLTHSELEAAKLIFQELGGKDGMLVATEVAKKFSISRSILIVALRKLKSAGIIESHSLGVKGTHIKVLNKKILDEIYNDSTAQVANGLFY